MRTLHISIIAILLIMSVLSINITYAQNYGLPPSEQVAHSTALQQALAQDNSTKPVIPADRMQPHVVNQILLSPLKQFKSGIQAQSVQCETGFELILKSQDGSPACVKPQTAQILIERGWGHCPLRLGFVNCP